MAFYPEWDWNDWPAFLHRALLSVPRMFVCFLSHICEWNPDWPKYVWLNCGACSQVVLKTGHGKERKQYYICTFICRYEITWVMYEQFKTSQKP